MHRVLILLVLLVSSFSIAAQESFSSVEERMTGKEFMATGLSKLTDSELDVLNKWLRDHSVATMESSLTHRNAAADAAAASSMPSSPTPAPQQSNPGSAAPATSTSDKNSANTVSTTSTESNATSNVDKRGFEGKDNDRNTIVSPLIGEFNGWDGETVFKLQNGQVWKQAESGRLVIKSIVSPVATIKSGMFNSWHLRVEGYNKNVQVERIQ